MSCGTNCCAASIETIGFGVKLLDCVLAATKRASLFLREKRLLQVRTAPKARGVVPIIRGVRDGDVVATVPIELCVDIVAASEVPFGIGRPLVKVANHVEGPF